jgi:DNA-binding beta-propeller fold protein YncE
MKVWALALVLSLAAGAAAAEPELRVLRRLPFGGEGGWDYLTVDDAARRLYVSRGTHVMVVDLDAGKLAGDIPDTPGVHGVAVAPELGRGFTSNGRADSATIFDLKTLRPLGQVKTGANPDAILYDPASHRVFTFNGRGKDATVFEAATGAVVATLPLGGKPEFAAADGAGRVYVNVEDTAEVVEIDSRAPAVARRFPLKGCEEPTGLALDVAKRRVFSVCHNRVMTVLDAAAGAVIASVPIGEGVDGAGFDPATGLAFSSNGGGSLTVVRESSPGKFEVAATVPTERGARTMALDPRTHEVYLPTASFGPPPPPTAESPRPRPAMVKDSFAILVIGR